MTTAAVPQAIDRRERAEPIRHSPWRVRNWRDLRDILAIAAIAVSALTFAVKQAQAGAYDTRISSLETNMRAVAYMTCAVFAKQYPDLRLPSECDAAVSRQVSQGSR